MTTLSSSGISRSEITVLTRIRRGRRLFILAFAVSFAAIAGLILLIPSKYESRMQLLVNSGRQDFVISPNDGKSPAAVQEFQENRVNSEIALMTSRDVLQQVVLKSNLSHEKGTVAAAGPPSPWYMNIAVNSLGRHLSIEPVKKSDVISVTYRARSPEVATAVLKNLEDTYLSMHLRAHAKPGTFKFFDNQADTFESRLNQSEDQLKTFREEHALADPEEKTPLAEKALEAQAALDQVTAQLADYHGRIKTAQEKLANLDPRVVSQVHTSPQTAVISQLSAKVAELQNRRTETLTKFRSDDRMVTQLDKEIADTKATIDDLRAHLNVETTTDINQVRLETERDLVASQVMLTGLEARQAKLQGILGAYKDRLSSIASASSQNDRLSRAVRENEQNYLLYSKEREEARIADSLDQQRITDVSVIESPTYEVQPVSPVVPVDLAIGFLLSLFVAYVVVMARDMLRSQSDSQTMAANAA